MLVPLTARLVSFAPTYVCPIAPERFNISPDNELIKTATLLPLSMAICCCIPVVSTTSTLVWVVKSTETFTFAVTVAAPVTPDTDVPAAKLGEPEIGEPDVGAVPLNAIEKDPVAVSNLELTDCVEPLLNTLNVG